MIDKWYKKSGFRNLVDMHISNEDDSLLTAFDPEIYAENMKIAGFDSAYIYGSNCLGLCLFDTETGYRHKEAYKRDLFGETVKACRKRGIRPLGYLNHWSAECRKRHPEWAVLCDGEKPEDKFNGRAGVCCLNSPYRDYFLKLVEQLCKNYDIEGLFIDMVGFWRDACYCESCRKKYKKETGRDIPTVIDWEDAKWIRYVKFKEDSVKRYIKDIVATAKKSKPEITVCIQSACWNLGYSVGFDAEVFREYDYAAGDFYTGVRDQAVDCKILRKVSANQPFEYMVSRCPGLSYHTVSKPMHQIRQQAYSAFLHGGAFVCIDAIDPKGTLNGAVYKMFGEVRKELEPYWKHPSFLRGEYLNDAAVYMNYRSMVNYDEKGVKANRVNIRLSPVERLKMINLALSEIHVQYDILTETKISELSKYPLVIVPEVTCISKEEAKFFREYVKNGGRLYVSGRSGMINSLEDVSPDEENLGRNEFAVSDVMGVSFEGKMPYKTVYVRPAVTDGIFDENHKEYPLSAEGPAPQISVGDKTRVLAYATFPGNKIGCEDVCFSALSNPPWTDSALPVLTEHEFGQGKCIYSSLLLENEAAEAVKELWQKIILYLLKGKRNVEIEAPTCVEASVKTADENIYVSLLNTLAYETQNCAGELKIKLSSSLLNFGSAECFPCGKLSCELKNDAVVITASELPEFSIVTVKPDKKS